MIDRRICRNDDGKWGLGKGAKPERAPDPPEQSNVDTPLARQVAQRVLADMRTPQAAPTPAADAIELQLTKAVERAQESLDEYLISVADPEVVAPLKESRDHARRALENYLKRKAAA